eukprot:s1281_g7.t1
MRRAIALLDFSFETPSPVMAMLRRAVLTHSSWRSCQSCRNRVTLRQLWSDPDVVGARPLAGPSSAAFRQHFEDAHQWRMTRAFGERMVNTPPSAAHEMRACLKESLLYAVFVSCAVLEGMFLCVNLGTLSPLIFEMFMPYHLKYTSLVFAWWGGTYLGLNVARYGPLAQGPWILARTLAGGAFMLAGVTGLVLADGLNGMGPWPSYWLLIFCYSGMPFFDVALTRRQMLPPWLLKWKLGVGLRP